MPKQQDAVSRNIDLNRGTGVDDLFANPVDWVDPGVLQDVEGSSATLSVDGEVSRSFDWDTIDRTMPIAGPVPVTQPGITAPGVKARVPMDVTPRPAQMPPVSEMPENWTRTPTAM